MALPVEVVSFLQLRARELRDLKSRAKLYGMEQAQLLAIAREHGIDTLEWSTEEADGELLVKRAREMCLDGDGELPFFSEAKLYELLGKENARTVLSFFNRLCQHVTG